MVRPRFLTIARAEEYNFKEKASLFTARCFSVSTAAEADAILFSLRKQYYDATHHCFAYRLSDDSFRYSDDGEPSGTAGIRIFSAIESSGFHNILLVVTRYFGGTKLGVGPLGKAYHFAAREALGLCTPKTMIAAGEAQVTAEYEQTNIMHRIFQKYGIRVLQTECSDKSVFTIRYPLEIKEHFLSALSELPHGAPPVVFTDTYYYIEDSGE